MKITPFIPCLLLITVPACGDDEKDDGGGGGTGTVDSGVDGSKPLSMLTDAEVQQIGMSYGQAAATPELLDGICKFSAVLTSSLSGGGEPGAAPTPDQVTACNDAYNMCKMQIDQAQSQGGAAAPPDDSVPSSAAAFAGCNVTVDQYEACLTATIAMLEQLYSGLSCDQPAMLDATGSTTDLAECQAFNQCSAPAPAPSGS